MEQSGIDYKWDKTLMRGLDYYSDICFEYIINERENVAQNAILAGGRYDSLYEKMGGSHLMNIYCSGFAMGVDRIASNIFYIYFLFF